MLKYYEICCIMYLSEKSDRQFGNEHSVDGSPQTPLHNGEGVVALWEKRC